jgi:hypothetical protein
MSLKKSNREGTGKKHNCLHCNNLIPLHKKFCNRICYNKYNTCEVECKGCGNVFNVPKNKNTRKYCSILCSSKNIDRKETKLKATNTLKERYNTDNPFNIIGYENLNINRNGDKISESLNNKSLEEKQIISGKISKSLKNKSTEEKNKIKQKREDTNYKKYGVKSTLELNSPLREKADKNNQYSHINRLNKWLLSHDIKLTEQYVGTKDSNGDIIYYKFKHIPSGNIFIDHVACGRLPIYKNPNTTIGISVQEQELQNFIKTCLPDDNIIFNTRHLIKGFEIDIYIPSYNLAIEYNGMFFHSENNGKGREYHLYKTEECEKQGIQLIHIFEDEWINKQNIIKSKLKNLLKINNNKIYARKCIIKNINNKEKNEFLNKNHIQGEDKSKIKLGLYHNNELVSVMTFGRLRKITGNKHSECKYELIRYASKLDTNVVGGFSKLLNNFTKTYTPQEIVSYADRRYSIGRLYEFNGFSFIHNTPPNYWYMKYYKNREHRFKYRKSELSKLLECYNHDISEWENMKNNKYDRIWDCGSKKYILYC